MTQAALFDLPVCLPCQGRGKRRDPDTGATVACAACRGSGVDERPCRICQEPAITKAGYCAGHDPETARIPY